MIRKINDWCSYTLFSLVHKNNLVYNTCWEDPRVDRTALDLTEDDTVAMITSAGCNALDYALLSPKKILAVDMNPRQNALLELKIAGIKRLDFEAFFQLFGEGYLPTFPEIYQKKLRPLLSPGSQTHWDNHLDYFTGSSFRPTFYFRGTSGLFARLVHCYIDLLKLRDPFISIFNAKSIKEQRELYFRWVDPRFWSLFVRWAMRRESTLSLLGVPRPQRQTIDWGYTGGVSRFIQDCVESVFTRLPLRDNYFWWLYFNGKYTKNRCPEYLKEHNFNRLRDGLVDRIHTHTGTLSHFLGNHNGQVSKYVLLDHMDWMSTHHRNHLAKEWQTIVDRAAPRARVIWRSGGLNVNFIDPIRVQIRNKDWQVGDLLTYHKKLASRLHNKDRVHTYGSFYIADLHAA